MLDLDIIMKKILLIEDNPGDARLIEEMILEFGNNEFEIEWVDTLKEGLDYLTTIRVDIVISDLSLTDSRGIETFNKVYTTIPTVPIIVMSGLSDESMAINAVKNGAQDYLVKGQIDGSWLLRAIRYAIERKQTEEILKIKENAIESSINGITISDLNGKITYVNEAFARMWGYENKEEIAGIPVMDLWQNSKEVSIILELLREKGQWAGELIAKKKDGATFYIQLSANIVKNVAGKTICMMTSFMDISDRKKAEESLRVYANELENLNKDLSKITSELKESNERFGTIFRSAMDGILLTKMPEKHFFMANEMIAKMLGYKQEELIRLRDEDIYRKEDFPYVMEQLEKLSCGEIAIAEEIPVKRKDGSIFYSDISATHVTLTGNECLMGIFRDVTERKQAEENMREAYELKSKFTSMVSHELRTPLTAIKEGIGIVLDGSAGEINEDQTDFLDTAKRNVDRLHRLINDVLDFAKLESGKAEFKMCVNDINEVISETVKTLMPASKEKGLYIKIELNSDIGKLKFDCDQVIQVVSNLINNAIKFTENGGVTVRSIMSPDDSSVQISVEDSGQGIKKEDVERLFNEFQQVGDDKYRKPGSTGLGLAICKEIVNAHDGNIWVESKKGEGCVFYFTLPMQE